MGQAGQVTSSRWHLFLGGAQQDSRACGHGDHHNLTAMEALGNQILREGQLYQI